ncbi:MAG: cupredoxin domain-containing protein [Trebonia sp.]|jgi:plastocyanin
MTKSNRSWLLLPLIILALVLTACGSSSSSSSSTPASSGGQTATGSPAAGKSAGSDTIVIKNFMFSPMSLTVAPGAMVTVHNEDSVTHTLTDKADPKLFSTGDVGPGQTKTFKAPDKPGSYPFFCMIHQYMTGTLVVS